MTHPWTLLLGLALLAVLFVLLRVAGGAYVRLRGLRGLWLLTCPQTHMQAVVRLDAFYAAWTAAFRRRPLVRVQGCTLWSRGAGCAQRCCDLPKFAVEGEPLPPTAVR